MPATIRGIYHNLRESKYVVSNSEITFYFSSEKYLKKFMDGYLKYRDEFKQRMNKLIDKTPLNMDTLADINYYKSIEKRGFFVRLQRAKIGWDDLYKYALRKMIDRETTQWSRVG
jgi:hypothetical protein